MGAERPKQYLELSGQSILARSLAVLTSASSVEGVVLVHAAEDSEWQTLVSDLGKPVITASGGEERCDSVLAGLEAIADRYNDESWVLVHDAARPLVRTEAIDRMESALMGHECGGLLAVPLKDTLKQASGQEVQSTVDRAALWHAQTPQVFRYGLLRDALHDAARRAVTVTDESMAMELAGHKPLLIPGSADNIKITVPEDIAMAEFLLSRRQDRGEGA